MRKLIAAFASVLLLAGCVGARSTMLSEDTAIVRADGNTIADQEKVVQASIKEAAEVSRAHGYSYFTVLRSVDKSSYGMRAVPGALLLTESEHDKSYGSTNLSSVNTPGATYMTPDTSVQYIRPALEITIRMYRQGEIDPKMQGVWSTDTVLGQAAPAR